jgi:phenylpropionate dioxygenase-like ring-hydroxylating dioxygenase large terminal subunit
VEDISLVQLATFEAEGFVWVVPSAGSSVDFADWLPPRLLDEIRWLGCADLEIFESTTRTWRANWKLIADGGLESYHFRVAHKNTIGPYFIDAGSTYELIGKHTRTVLPRRNLFDLSERPEEEWRIRGYCNLLYSLFPSASLLVQEDHVVLVRSCPVLIDETRIQVSTLGPKRPHSEEVAKHFGRNHEVTLATLEEDFAIAEQIQRGLHSGANAFFRLGRYEAAIARLHEKIDRMLTVRDPRAASSVAP